MSMDSFFGSLFDMVDHESQPMNRCPKCGLAFSDFKRTGLLGCSFCYEHFSAYLMPTIKRVQGGVLHTGKIPVHASPDIVNKRKLDRLQLQLKELIAEERFEEAAAVRDEIKTLKASMKEDDSHAG